MRVLRALLARVAGLARRRRGEADVTFENIEAELASHLQMDIEDGVAHGFSPAEAERHARARLGGVSQTRERHADVRRGAWPDGLSQDLRYAWRSLRRTPSFTIGAVLLIAVGIGLNVAVFTVINAVFFKGFALVDHNDRLRYLHGQKDGFYSGVSYADYREWRTSIGAFTDMAVVGDLKLRCDRDGFAEVCFATRVTANAFGILGVQPMLGRGFVEQDDRPGAPPVAILSYRFWERRFAKNPDVVGRTLSLAVTDQTLQNGRGPSTQIAARDVPTTIVGVMPEGFAFPQNQDLWVPLVPATPGLEQRAARNLWFAFGRLRDGVSAEAAQAELDAVAGNLARAYPDTNQGQGIHPDTFAEFFVGEWAPMAYRAIWGAVVCVLLIACANLASLMASRAGDRVRELSVRAALGAGRWRLLCQLGVECLLLASAGALGGTFLAWGAVRMYAIATNPAASQWNHNLLAYQLDGAVLLYGLMSVAVTVGMFGLAPAVWIWKARPQAAMKEAAAGAASRRGQSRLSFALLTAEVVLALVLLVGAGAMVRGFSALAAAPLGARPDRMAGALLRVPTARYPDSESRGRFYEHLLARMAALPGVEAATVGPMPASGLGMQLMPFAVDGQVLDVERGPKAGVAVVGPDYVWALSAHVLQGREFTRQDAAGAMPVAMVNQRLAERQWRGRSPIGERVQVREDSAAGQWRTVVGVVSDVMYDPRRRDVAPAIYLPFAQTNRVQDPWILVRSRTPPASVIAPLRTAIREADPDVMLWLGPVTLDERLAMGLYGDLRNQTALLTVFGVVALVLASVGVYSVLLYAVGRRKREIGIRVAIGASRGAIRRLVVHQAMLPVVLGAALGVVASIRLAPAVESPLLPESQFDPATLAVAVGVLLACALAGTIVPVRRALRVDPVTALRAE